jgi:hypothetical protein
MVLDQRDPPIDPSRIALGLRSYTPSGTLARTLRPRNRAEPEHAKASAQGLGARPSLRLSIDDMSEPDP